MYLKLRIMRSTNDFSISIKRLQSALDEAVAVLVGAGAGLSTSAGFTYTGERFERYFSDFSQKYGFSDMYSGGFYPYSTPEEFWAYWSRYIYINRYMDTPKTVYDDLLRLIKDKDYFVITTNVDHAFQKSGFDKERLFYTQGDYGLFQCSEPCSQETYDNEIIIERMMKAQSNMRVPSELLPFCPHCKRPMTMNLRSDDKFVEDEGWHRARERYGNFVKTRRGKRILLLELGVGFNTPGIVKFSFWRMTEANLKATYACINYGEASCPEEISDRSILINADIGEVLSALLDESGSSSNMQHLIHDK